MNKLENAVYEMKLLEEQAGGCGRLNSLPALFKVMITVWYILLTVSFHKYDIFGLLGMGIYPLVLFLIYEIPFRQCIKRIKIILPFLLLVGIANPFLDKNILTSLGKWQVSGGVVSMSVLILKGFFSVLAGYLLIVSTSIEKICGALQKIHMPSILITMILLIYRYISLLLKETNRVIQAYALRAPGQKGAQFKAWGSLAGLLLLRSMDRAENVYESMCLRGFESSRGNSFHYTAVQKAKPADYIWLLLWGTGLLALRTVPLLTTVGDLLVKG